MGSSPRVGHGMVVEFGDVQLCCELFYFMSRFHCSTNRHNFVTLVIMYERIPESVGMDCNNATFSSG